MRATASGIVSNIFFSFPFWDLWCLWPPLRNQAFQAKKGEKTRLRHSKFPWGTEGDEHWHHWVLHGQFCQVGREITAQAIMTEGKETCMAITSPSSHELLSSSALSGNRWGTQNLQRERSCSSRKHALSTDTGQHPVMPHCCHYFWQLQTINHFCVIDFWSSDWHCPCS